MSFTRIGRNKGMTSSHRVAGAADSQAAAGMIMAGKAAARAGLAGDDTITESKIAM
jgi:hypothetical protein